MRIRMLSSRRGAEDGIALRTYEAGQEYVLPKTKRGLDLGAVFIREGWAELAEEQSPAESAPEAAVARVAETDEPTRPVSVPQPYQHKRRR